MPKINHVANGTDPLPAVQVSSTPALAPSPVTQGPIDPTDIVLAALRDRPLSRHSLSILPGVEVDLLDAALQKLEEAQRVYLDGMRPRRYHLTPKGALEATVTAALTLFEQRPSISTEELMAELAVDRDLAERALGLLVARQFITVTPERRAGSTVFKVLP